MTKARRPYLYVINTLRDKYARLKGQQAVTPGSNQVAEDMAHVAAVLRMYDPQIDLAAIPPRRPYKPQRERWSRTALRILRTADRPLKARELARMVMRAEGVPLDDHKALVSISCSVQAVFSRLQAQGHVYTVGKPRRWAVVP